ncbi:MAG: metallophosphoesterase family protein [Candidatus Aminicenantes bacterium]|nr:metallophosphoesterase family protein [Candidatus Aminicenantes bacterium]
MTVSRTAVLSDIHGNRWALEAVLDDIRRRGIRDRINLGDCLYGPLDPAGTARILMELAMPTVRGNEDRIIIEKVEKHPDATSLPFVRDALQPEHFAWLETLPFTARVDEDFFLCHGTPERDDDYLLHEITSKGCKRRPAAAIALKLESIAQPVVLCGHDHLPASLRLPDGRQVVNPGSVGLPAYRDDLPFPHAMESGSPHARYSIVSRSTSGLAVENIAVAYDWQNASAAAAQNGRPDWAGYLRTGKASW